MMYYRRWATILRHPSTSSGYASDGKAGNWETQDDKTMFFGTDLNMSGIWFIPASRVVGHKPLHISANIPMKENLHEINIIPQFCIKIEKNQQCSYECQQ
jgi:hypothetical protein